MIRLDDYLTIFYCYLPFYFLFFTVAVVVEEDVNGKR